MKRINLDILVACTGVGLLAGPLAVMAVSQATLKEVFAATAPEQALADSVAAVSDATSTSSLSYLDYDTYSAVYFRNLTTNFGWNSKGSCGYVALDMLASFWDSYWNDGYIPESYDQNTSLTLDSISLSDESPGIKDEGGYYNPYSAAEYYAYVTENAGSHHHLNLIKLGNEQFSLYDFKDYLYPCSIFFDDLCEFTEYYLYDVIGKSEADLTLETCTASEAKEFAIKRIKHGIPVMLALRTDDWSGGHVVVAYDYDADSDTIYVHPGWHNESTHQTLAETGYPSYVGAIAITPLSDHSHTDNYVYSGASGTSSHCPCELDGLTDYTDAHTYTESYTIYSSTYHKAYCYCGDYTCIKHVYGSSYNSGAKLYASCIYCGYIVDLTKEIVPYL